MENIKMNARQKKFCDYYIESSNGAESAVKAGYSAATASSIASENLNKPHLKAYIDSKLEELSSSTIADAREIRELYTSIARGEVYEEQFMNIGGGQQDIVQVKTNTRDRMRAAELLSRQVGFDKDDLDKEQQRIIIEKLKKDIEVNVAAEDKLAEYFDKLGDLIDQSQ